MTHRVALTLAGVPLTVSADDPATAAEVARLWSRALVPAVPTGSAEFVVTGGEGADRGLLALSTEVNGHVLAQTPFFAVHAAVVTLGDRCFALCAVSGTGKSTTTGALLRRGWSYVSDEALCLDTREDTRGRVVPYPRPLGLLPWSRSALGLTGAADDAGESLHAPDELGAGPLPRALPVTDVVLLTRTGRVDPLLGDVSRQTAATELLRHSFNHFHDPAAAFATAHHVVAGARVYRLDVGSPAATAALLESVALS